METTPLIDFLLSSWEAKERIVTTTYKRLRTLDILIVAASFLGLIIFQIETNSYYEQVEILQSIIVNKKTISNVITYKEEEENYENFLYRVVLLASTCFLGYMLILRARTYLFYLKITNRIELDSTFYSSGITFRLILELLFIFLISYPKYNMVFSGTLQDFPLYYSLDQIMSLFQFGRIYILVRMWTQYSQWNKDTSRLICNLCNTDGGFTFSMKAEFKKNPVVVFGMFFTISILFLGFATRTSERSYSYVVGLNWDSIWNGIWMIVIIISTVGYGDFFARTYLGRVFVFVTCCFGPFMISMVNVSISNYLFFNKPQKKAYEKIANIEDRITLRHYASNCIKISIKYWGHANLLFKSSRSTNSQKQFSQIFNKYKQNFLCFHKKRLQVNTVGFNKPFDELLHQFNKSNTEEFTEVFYYLSDITTKLNLHMAKINTNHDLIDIKMKEVSFKYDHLHNFIMKNPYHQQKFIKFSASLVHSNMNFLGSNSPVLTYNDLSSVESIKEIINKERKDSQQSCLSIQSPVSAAKERSNRSKKEITIVEINDMIKQLSKKKNFRAENEESPKMKANKIRGTIKKSTTVSNMKKTDGLEIIHETEENKENIIGSGHNKTLNKFDKQISGKNKKIPRFKRFKMETCDKMENTEEKEKNVYPKISSKIEENNNEKQKECNEPNESNFSVNFSSQMPTNMPFNMSVNVNRNPVFTLSSSMHTSPFPFTINVESKKITESPVYPENNILESKDSSFKLDDSTFNEKLIDENKDNKDNKNNKEKKDGKENSECKDCKENHNLFRQRKIVIEHSMLITESIIEGSPVRQFTKDSNKGSGNLPKIASNKGIFENFDNAENNEGLANLD